MKEGAPIRTRGPAMSSGTIADRSSAGRRASAFARLDVPEAPVPQGHERSAPAALPQVAIVCRPPLHDAVPDKNCRMTTALPASAHAR